ncbi:cubilin-like [Diadema antillarum]|uniref:cubilin-like n=1 Tax=Diadema antillarum TaxID=105358 RepID=UPI003A893481
MTSMKTVTWLIVTISLGITSSRCLAQTSEPDTIEIVLPPNGIVTLQSKNYPSNYHSDYHEQLLWLVSASSGCRIRISFTAFSLEHGVDFLTIGTGRDPTNIETVLVRLSGDFLPDDIVTPTDKIWLAMDSSLDQETAGFHLELEVTTLDETVQNTLGFHQKLTLRSPGHPGSEYPNDVDIFWPITCLDSCELLVLFEHFRTQFNHDILSIGQGHQRNDNPSRTVAFSGSSSPGEYFSHSSTMWISFVSDYSITNAGFELTVYPVSSGAESARDIVLDTGELCQNIFSPGYPYNYPNEANELWTVTAPSGYGILIEFRTFELEDVQFDFVTVGTGRNHSDGNSTVLGEFGGPLKPQAIFPLSPLVWIRFMSDSSRTYKGFWIRLSAVALQGMVNTIVLAATEEREIVSPSYPDVYPANLDIVWIITTARCDRNIFLRVSEIHLREGQDSILVGSGDVINETTVLLNLTRSDLPNASLVSPGNRVWIWFTSGSIRESGSQQHFRIQIKETVHIAVGNEKVEITSMNYPSDYPNEYRDLWFVSPPEGQRVKVKFLNFDLEHKTDFLTIGTGQDPTALGTVLVRFSGEFLPDVVVTPTGDIWISMTTDEGINHNGFRLHVLSTTLAPSVVNVLSREQNFTFHSPNYPISEYPSNADITWVLTSDDAPRLLILFEEFELENTHDVLILGNSLDPANENSRIVEYSGISSPPDGAFFLSSTMWLRFVSDHRDGFWNYVGFSLTIYPVSNDTNGKKNITLDSRGWIDIFSPNFPSDYPYNADVIWEVSAPLNHVISIDFRIFELERFQYDFVTIGSGRASSISSEILGEFGGTSLPESTVSTGRFIWIRFVSDGLLNYRGFWIRLVSMEMLGHKTRSSAQSFTTAPPAAQDTTDRLRRTDCPILGGSEKVIRRVVIPTSIGTVAFLSLIIIVLLCVIHRLRKKNRSDRPDHKMMGNPSSPDHSNPINSSNSDDTQVKDNVYQEIAFDAQDPVRENQVKNRIPLITRLTRQQLTSCDVSLGRPESYCDNRDSDTDSIIMIDNEHYKPFDYDKHGNKVTPNKDTLHLCTRRDSNSGSSSESRCLNDEESGAATESFYHVVMRNESDDEDTADEEARRRVLQRHKVDEESEGDFDNDVDRENEEAN